MSWEPGQQRQQWRFFVDPTIDVRRLRGLLAERRIPHKEYAAACGLNPSFVSRILAGSHAGELARIKLARGIERLGLECEVAHAAS